VEELDRAGRWRAGASARCRGEGYGLRMAVVLIRHGETAANAARVVQRPEVPLSERGMEQAERLAARLAGAGIARILASDLARAAQTAERLAEATGAPVEHEALLQERNFGALRGTPYTDLPGDLFAPDLHPPGGESWEQFFERVRAAWARVEALAAETSGHLAVVTHGLVCQAVVTRHAAPLGDDAPLGFGWANTSVTVLEPPAPWRVRLLNCTAHLEQVATKGIV